MRDDERRGLAEVVDEYNALREMVAKSGVARSLAAEHLEATYLVRLCARFEGLLRRRLSLSSEDESSLVNLIQRLSGETVGYDPADDGRALAWWRLFRRDRNLLAHGRSLVPVLGLSTTRTLMEAYLSGLRS